MSRVFFIGDIMKNQQENICKLYLLCLYVNKRCTVFFTDCIKLKKKRLEEQGFVTGYN